MFSDPLDERLDAHFRAIEETEHKEPAMTSITDLKPKELLSEYHRSLAYGEFERGKQVNEEILARLERTAKYREALTDMQKVATNVQVDDATFRRRVQNMIDDALQE